MANTQPLSIINGDGVEEEISPMTHISSVYDDNNVKLDVLMANKQDKLTAGDNITIDADGKISATGGGTVPADLQTNVDALMAKCFPLEVSSSANNTTQEVGTAVVPTITLGITRQGSDVSSSASVSITSPTSGVTVSDDNKTITGTSTSDGSYRIQATVTQSGQSVKVDKSWAWSNYRYYGVLDSVPADTTAIVQLIESGNDGSTTTYNSTELSTDLSISCVLGSKASPVSIPAGKAYIFAVKTTSTIHIYDANFGELTGFPSGEVTVEQKNYASTSLTNTYKYAIIEASAVAQQIYISNS